MQWFKHDTNAAQDAKMKKLVLRHGAEGYAVYFHCVELIAGDISESNLTFELEHDAEIIADNLKIKGDTNVSGIEKVNIIMRYIISLGLFSESNGSIYCYKLLKRLDQSMTSNQNLRKMIENAKQNHDTVMIPSCKSHDTVMQEENRREEKRIEERGSTATPHPEGKYPRGILNNVLLLESEYISLCHRYTKAAVDSYIDAISLYLPNSKNRYKDFNATIHSWIKKDKDAGTYRFDKKPEPAKQESCPDCGERKYPSTDICPECKHDFINGGKFVLSDLEPGSLLAGLKIPNTFTKQESDTK